MQCYLKILYAVSIKSSTNISHTMHFSHRVIISDSVII